MINTLVTGATGAVGSCIVRSLLRNGYRVRALVRDPDRARAIVPPSVELIQGDVTKPSTLPRAFDNIEWVFHAAGVPEHWHKDTSIYFRVNTDGTRHMADAALAAGVSRFVYTSCLDVFPHQDGQNYDESVLDPEIKLGYYERSMQYADAIVRKRMEIGLPAVFVCPAILYGPSPSNSSFVNHLIRRIDQGKARMVLPGGVPVVYCQDVGDAQVRAAERAAVGSRYILANARVELREIAELTLRMLGIDTTPPFTMPWWMARLAGTAIEMRAALNGAASNIQIGYLRQLQETARPIANRAYAELGWESTSLEAGLRATIDFMHGGRAPNMRMLTAPREHSGFTQQDLA
jgi:dihydroflavonol-4-reductase